MAADDVDELERVLDELKQQLPDGNILAAVIADEELGFEQLTELTLDDLREVRCLLGGSSARLLGGLAPPRRLTGPVGETPEPESRRSARSDHKTQPGEPSSGWSEDTHQFVRQTNTRKGGYYQKTCSRVYECVGSSEKIRRHRAPASPLDDRRGSDEKPGRILNQQETGSTRCGGG